MTSAQQVKRRFGTWTGLSAKVIKVIRENQALLKKDPDFYAMRTLARFQMVREWMTQNRQGSALEAPLLASEQVSMRDAFETVSYRLRQEGYYQGLQLSPATLNAFLQFAETTPCYANRDAQLKFSLHQRESFAAELGRPILIGSYFDAHESFETFQALKADPVLRAIATAYLGHEPQYHRGEIAWSFPAPASEAEKLASAQVLHCDINDYKTIKFFFYLTEVDAGSGPHIYLRGTHRHRTLQHQLLGQRCASIPDATLVETYGADRVTTVCGPAGFGFVGDPYTFHQGTTPTHHPRLLLQLEFGIRTYKTWYFETTTPQYN